MPKPSKTSLTVLMLPAWLCLGACVSSPPLAVAVQCPAFPVAPPSLLEPPQALTALTQLQDALQQLVDPANTMPPSLPDGSIGTPDRRP